MERRTRRVVIVGGGFGGLEVAKALDGADVEVLLVDRGNYHLFQPLLYQVAMAGLSPSDIASPIRGILSRQRNVRVVLGEVSDVDLVNKRVCIDDREPAACSMPRPREVEQTWEPYDWLVLAIGATNSYFGHDEWELYAPGLKGVEDALEVRRRVLLAFERAERTDDARERRKLLTFVVIGGGPTGVEMSGAIAELARFTLSKDFQKADLRQTKVVLVEAGPRILPSFPEDLARSAVDQLAELGVEVLTHAKVVAIDQRGVELQGQDQDDVPSLGCDREHTRIDAGTVLWAAGVRANDLTRKLGVDLDRQGRVIVEKDCSLPGHPDVFAIGDMARFEENGRPLPGVSPVAMQQGSYVAKVIRWEAEGDGRPPRTPFRYLDKGSMATIGRSRAIAMVGSTLKMRGFIAWLAWLFIHIFYLIGFRNRIIVLLNWFWSYVSYGRGARLITSTGWTPAHVAAAPAELGPRIAGVVPLPETIPESVRPPSSKRPTAAAGSPASVR
jgi:NADH dehydrogenase